MRLGEVERHRDELAEFVADVFASLPRRDQRRWGECYGRGLMPDGRRKSIQPMAERLPDGNTQALRQFVNQSPWDPLPVHHFEGRTWCGRHHHVTLVTAAQAFLTLRRLGPEVPTPA
ncbi:hypothetical protein A4E84_07555 [Streptomyces qaidamensis]|uniref:Transposase IS701-like DDE domain-containing protein n=1 Tax=Streptomyces qaidamensis TaxID=1783515 RepID=A0A143BVW9_9ACTN|nr:hypothetical protein A4E84_07555 [Streptomyces qaidamensis]